MIIHDIQQCTEEWLKVRLGKVTASRFSDVMAKGAGKTRKSYMIQLAAEIMTGEPQNGYSSAAMEWGTEQEPFARQYYETIHDCPVEQVGFIELNEWVGVSPDGLVGADGDVEIKCPNTSTHIATILADKVPTTHKPQIQGQLWVTDRKWCDFISYDPRMKQRPFFCKRVMRDEAYIKELEIQVTMFVTELKEMIEKLTVNEF